MKTADTPPIHFLTDAERRDVGAWSAWCAKHPAVHADLAGADLSDTNLDGAVLRDAVGVRHPDVVAATPFGSGEMCTVLRGPNGTVTIWVGRETFASFAACRSRIIALGGPDKAERLACLAWVQTRLAKETS